jgi:hypothetical protein
MNKDPQIRHNGRGGLSKKALDALMRQAERDLGHNRAILGDVAPSGLASDEVLRSRGYVAGAQGGEKVKPQPTYTPAEHLL